MRHFDWHPVLLTTVWILTIPGPALATEPDPPDDGDTGQPRVSLPTLLESFDDEPPIRDVQAAALDHADLDQSNDASWRARARWSNLFPEVDGEIAWLDQRDETFRYTEDIEADENGRLKRDSARNRLYQDARFRTVYSVDAKIDLGGLVFDRDELSASREERQREAARRELVSLVTDLYYERRKKQILRLAEPPSDWRDRLDLVLEIDRLTARLDGLTGGWFRDQLDNAQGGRADE